MFVRVCVCAVQPMSISTVMAPACAQGEGRSITIEYPAFFLVNVYVPNSGMKLERLDFRVKEWDPTFTAYLKVHTRGRVRSNSQSHSPYGTL